MCFSFLFEASFQEIDRESLGHKRNVHIRKSYSMNGTRFDVSISRRMYENKTSMLKDVGPRNKLSTSDINL